MTKPRRNGRGFELRRNLERDKRLELDLYLGKVSLYQLS